MDAVQAADADVIAHADSPESHEAKEITDKFKDIAHKVTTRILDKAKETIRTISPEAAVTSWKEPSISPLTR